MDELTASAHGASLIGSADAVKESARDIARRLAPKFQCNCDLDNWQPEPSTGHSQVCRIHKAAVEEHRNGRKA